jgi:type IV pilus assembly protein PilW
VELMIAMFLGLLITALLITVYVRSYTTNRAFQSANSQIENGRFALQMLTDDLRVAGYWGEYALLYPPTTPITAVEDPCTSTVANATWANNVFYQAVQGYNNAVPAGSSSTCVPTAYRQSGTDVLVVRHADTCGAGTCTNGAGLNLQVSLCNTDASPYILDTTSTTTTATLHQKNCTTLVPVRHYVSDIYWVRNYAVTAGDNIPTLMRTVAPESGATSTEPLIQGIEGFKVEYAQDTNGDGIPDTDYTPSSSTWTQTDWSQVVAVRLYVLARGSAKQQGYSDTKTYSLSNLTICSTAGSCSGKTLDPTYMRHVYTTVVRLVNPAGRKYQ